MKKLLKRKDGTTLIELIVGMLVFAILAASVTAVVTPVVKVIARTNDYAELNLLLDNIAEEIINDLRGMRSAVVTGTVLEINLQNQTVRYNNIGGYLYRGDTAMLFGSGFYENKAVNVSYYDENGSAAGNRITAGSLPPVFVVRIEITTENLTAGRDYAVKPLAMIAY